MTEKWVDLHVHTYYSDGLLSPAEVVREAKKTGLSAIGIADHDTVGGIAEAIEAGKKEGVEIVKCVEFSSQYAGRDIHILGYFIDENHPRMAEYLTLFRNERYHRAEKIVNNLDSMGVHISIDEVAAKARGNIIGRPHIAEILMEKGYVETFQESFHRFIGYGCKAYEEKFRIVPEKAIALINESQGLSFLAHPGPIISDQIILHLIKSGLDGVEIVHPKLNDRRMARLQKIVKNHGLLVSGGSDCHGGRNGSMTMGRFKVPYSILEQMKKYAAARRAMGC